MQTVNNTELYEDGVLIVDVRTPSEYDAYHIEGAINLPLFTDEERHDIGTTYKKRTPNRAKKLGMHLISTKIDSIGQSIIDYSDKYDKIIVYCQRGGMRSRSLVSLMNALEINNIYQLIGGIKGHRQFIDESLVQLMAEKTFVTLHGLTGVGKTKILNDLENNHLVLNYEVLAQHAGSVFGRILFTGTVPKQKQFEETLFTKLYKHPSQYVFIESESKRVGTIMIPDIYMTALLEGEHIYIDTSLENRIKNLMADYSNDDHGPLKEAVTKLKKRLSNEVVEKYIEYIDNNQLESLVEGLLLNYYDPLYNYSIEKYTYDEKIYYNDISEAVTYIETLFKERKLNA